jgi:hypothetical protein
MEEYVSDTQVNKDQDYEKILKRALKDPDQSSSPESKSSPNKSSPIKSDPIKSSPIKSDAPKSEPLPNSTIDLKITIIKNTISEIHEEEEEEICEPDHQVLLSAIDSKVLTSQKIEKKKKLKKTARRGSFDANNPPSPKEKIVLFPSPSYSPIRVRKSLDPDRKVRFEMPPHIIIEEGDDGWDTSIVLIALGAIAVGAATAVFFWKRNK